MTTMPGAANQVILVSDDDGETVGCCSVCYLSLPTQSNHVFTICGHLFCVKCLLKWAKTSSVCPMCRAKMMDDDAEDVDNVSEVSEDSELEPFHVLDNYAQYISNQLPRHVVTEIDRYLYLDSDVAWYTYPTDPERDDDSVRLSHYELETIRWNREIILSIYSRQCFREALFSDNMYLGEVFHTFIPKREWLRLANLGPSRMYEFVLRRDSTYTPLFEKNFFGYISQIMIVFDRDHDNENTFQANHEIVDETEWENTHEYVFIVNAFSPAASYGRYCVDEGTYEPVELTFRFRDVRRLYSIIPREIVSA